jgi:hypothetical protein
MENKNNDVFQAFEPENEVKAFIYQQVQDLESLMKDLGSLAVYIEKEDGQGESPYEKFAVTYVLAPESVNLQIRSESSDIFEACRAGKEEAQRKLNSLINFMGEQEGAAGAGTQGWLH